MSKDPVPSTPITFAAFTNQKLDAPNSDSKADTLPIYIAEKLDALGRDPHEADLHTIRVYLYSINQQERMVSDEEVRVWKTLEKKVLENQKYYKNETEKMNDRAKFSTRFCLFFPLPVLLFAVVIGAIMTREAFLKLILLLTSWPIKLFAVVFLFNIYFPNGGFLDLCGISMSFKPHVLRNEDEDDDWEDSITSTELQSRQKALVNGWEQLRKERKKQFGSDFLAFIPLVANLAYSFIRFAVVINLVKQNSSSIFLVVEYIFSFALLFLFVIQFLQETHHRETFEKKSGTIWFYQYGM